MKKTPAFYGRALHRCLLLIISIHVLIILPGCKKLLGTEELKFSGRITDDITGFGIQGGGSIKVDGYNGNAAGFFAVDRKSNIGSGKINADGSFTVSFTKWEDATIYEFGFLYPNNGYINNGSKYLNTFRVSSAYFSGGSHNMNITAAKMTDLKVNFKNVSPFNADDSLRISLPQATTNILFGYLMSRWENLQNCTAGFSGGITGGVNASGTLRCNVPADRKFKIEWLKKKNGVITNYSDSLSCSRNTTTIYNLDY